MKRNTLVIFIVPRIFYTAFNPNVYYILSDSPAAFYNHRIRPDLSLMIHCDEYTIKPEKSHLHFGYIV